MLELVLTVCSLAQGVACHDLDAIPLGNAPITMCLFASQVEGVKWVEDNPTFYVKRATCKPSKRFAKG
jgi:hypothetical protein